MNRFETLEELLREAGEESSESFLDWCIENSFEVDEETKLATRRLENLKKLQFFHENKWDPEKMIKAYKAHVEYNLMIRLAKYGIAIVVIYKIFH